MNCSLLLLPLLPFTSSSLRDIPTSKSLCIICYQVSVETIYVIKTTSLVSLAQTVWWTVFNCYRCIILRIIYVWNESAIALASFGSKIMICFHTGLSLIAYDGDGERMCKYQILYMISCIWLQSYSFLHVVRPHSIVTKFKFSHIYHGYSPFFRWSLNLFSILWLCSLWFPLFSTVFVHSMPTFCIGDEIFVHFCHIIGKKMMYF